MEMTIEHISKCYSTMGELKIRAVIDKAVVAARRGRMGMSDPVMSCGIDNGHVFLQSGLIAK